MTTITGETRLFPILGDPIAQVRSPRYLTEILERRGQNAIVPPMHVAPEHLATTVAALKATHNVDGLVITIPHKIPTLDLCDAVTERARFVGSVNIVRKREDGSWIGDNVDGIGYMDGIKNLGFDVAGKRALLVGAGGAGSAVAFEILDRGASYLGIYDISPERLSSLVTRLNDRFPKRVGVQRNDPTGYDLIANVTPVGMKKDDPYPVDIDQFNAGQFVADAITKPEVSPMVEAARAKGCNTMTGAGMFNAEAEILVDYMLGML
jgi:shikimate dehydrogenase